MIKLIPVVSLIMASLCNVNFKKFFSRKAATCSILRTKKLIECNSVLIPQQVFNKFFMRYNQELGLNPSYYSMEYSQKCFLSGNNNPKHFLMAYFFMFHSCVTLTNNKNSNNYFVKYLLCARHCQTQRGTLHILYPILKKKKLQSYVFLLTFFK